ncbi:MAG: Holliday junction branch migration protein RuvA [Alphaproteobacteria bacterium]
MIGKLTGRVDSVAEDHAIIDVNGVGYLVYASAKTMGALPASGGIVSLRIETHVREDHFHLYGFATEAEREWFRILTTVQGVGVKLALAILSVFAPEELLAAIGAQDRKALGVVSGVGPKLAERIVTELKSQAGKMGAAGYAFPAAHAGARKTKAPGGTPVEDAISALVHLGYGRTEAFTAVMRVQQNAPGAKLDVLIKEGLKELAA